MQSVELHDLGRQPYQPVWELQKAIQQRLISQKREQASDIHDSSLQSNNDVLLFVEHPHVYTLGKSGDASHLLKELTELENIDAEFIEVDRGGDITYHGPGQIVGYPILDLDRYFTDIHKYMRCLEEVVIRTCAEYNISAGRIKGLTGVWVEGAKICAMGVRCSRWVTMHGFAFNINANLNYFNHIIPCGIDDKDVTSLKKVLGRQVDEQDVKNHLANHFTDVFEVNITKSATLYERVREFSYL